MAMTRALPSVLHTETNSSRLYNLNSQFSPSTRLLDVVKLPGPVKTVLPRLFL
jgi:hypothetical protein